MTKASPIVRSFNAGETSPLVEGRTDIDRYPASNRQMLNAVAAPQGPWIPRSGTEFIQATYDHDTKSSLLPFVFSETDTYMIEFTDERIRFFTNDGLLIRAPVAATMDSQSPFKIDSATLNAAVGDQVSLSDWPPEYNLNGEVANIVGKVGTVYELDISHPALADATGIKVAQVYHIASPYTEDRLEFIRGLQSLDVIYLVDGKKQQQKLKRKDTYDWSFEAVVFEDGPYLDVNETSTKLSLSDTGNAIPNMTANNLPSGSTASSSPGETAGYEAYKAFDAQNHKTSWVSSGTTQVGHLQYQTSSGFICDGYSIYIGLINDDVSYSAKDRAPSSWTFEGSNDGSTWTVLDQQNNYVLYTSNKSVFFKIQNTTSYTYYRLNVDTLTRNGTQNLTVGRLVLRSTTSTTITVTASAVTGINNDQGFLTTDVGRLIRIKGVDNIWRSLRITSRTNSTVVVCKLLSEPFSTLDGVTTWRLGTWSDTTGWPNTMAFYQDRLWFGGSDVLPDNVVGSVSGDYENMTVSDPDGVVLDTHSINVTLNSRRRSRLKWIQGSDKGLLAGTGSQEFVIAPGDGSEKALTPGTAKGKESSSRGSADVEPLGIDRATLYLQRGGRTLREYAWVYEVDGYKSPSMSMLASHMGAIPFEQMAYAAEPYSIVWLRNALGELKGLTYNRDENVVGWHRHDLSGGYVESIATLPSADGLQDVLWLVVKRTVDGQQKRYIERLTRFWDFNMTVDDAHFVDCALRYDGPPVTKLYGFQHLEAHQDIYGVADRVAVGPLAVVNGSVELNIAASKVVLGIGFESLGETARLENGAQDGTALGKEKRAHNLSAIVWQSYGGQLGVWNEDTNEIDWSDVEYPVTDYSNIEEEINLYNGEVGPTIAAPGYSKRGSVFFRRTKDKPLPFNITALMPQLVTQDRG